MGCIYKELLINTSININFRIMNKKFSTLLAGALLVTAFSAGAANVAPNDVKAGEY